MVGADGGAVIEEEINKTLFFPILNSFPISFMVIYTAVKLFGAFALMSANGAFLSREPSTISTILLIPFVQYSDVVMHI